MEVEIIVNANGEASAIEAESDKKGQDKHKSESQTKCDDQPTKQDENPAKVEDQPTTVEEVSIKVEEQPAKPVMDESPVLSQ